VDVVAKESKFYLVWSPEGPTEPKVRHETVGQAFEAAKQMAHKHRGQTFYVMAMLGFQRRNLKEAAPTPEPAEAAR
jgi:hypothetical protein